MPIENLKLKNQFLASNSSTEFRNESEFPGINIYHCELVSIEKILRSFGE